MGWGPALPISLPAITPHIVLDGTSHKMNKSTLGAGIYDFEYQLPAGRDRVAYYYLVNFNVEGNSVATPRESLSSANPNTALQAPRTLNAPAF